ncbi:hypothetical protein K9M41_01655 [Candidatus Gracilibacteria bacterium]|nr:hypothetical protein [Candidatus Gracilibacteria bacterium]
MYNRKILGRYADTIEDSELKEAFVRETKNIVVEGDTGFCTDTALEMCLSGNSKLEALLVDIRTRVEEGVAGGLVTEEDNLELQRFISSLRS